MQTLPKVEKCNSQQNGMTGPHNKISVTKAECTTNQYNRKGDASL